MAAKVKGAGGGSRRKRSESFPSKRCKNQPQQTRRAHQYHPRKPLSFSPSSSPPPNHSTYHKKKKRKKKNVTAVMLAYTCAVPLRHRGSSKADDTMCLGRNHKITSRQQPLFPPPPPRPLCRSPVLPARFNQTKRGIQHSNYLLELEVQRLPTSKLMYESCDSLRCTSDVVCHVIPYVQ